MYYYVRLESILPRRRTIIHAGLGRSKLAVFEPKRLGGMQYRYEFYITCITTAVTGLPNILTQFPAPRADARSFRDIRAATAAPHRGEISPASGDAILLIYAHINCPIIYGLVCYESAINTRQRAYSAPVD